MNVARAAEHPGRYPTDAEDPHRLVYVTRTLRLPLLDDRYSRIGTLVDVVVGTPNRSSGPPLLGFVANVAGRRVFVPATHVARASTSGVRLAHSAIDVRAYLPRPGEITLASLIGARSNGDHLVDIGLAHADLPVARWTVSVVVVAPRIALRRRGASRTVDWREVDHLFSGSTLDRELARFRDLEPSEVADALRRVDPEQRRQLMQMLPDDALADVVETLSDAEQIMFTDQLAPDRLAGLVAEMEGDDAVDLLGGISAERRERLLGAIDAVDSTRLRELLAYPVNTAGGVMHPDPIALSPSTMTAEGLVHMRSSGRPLGLASVLFVTELPTLTPTGTYRGAVSFRRLLRSAPNVPLAQLVQPVPEPIAPALDELELADLCLSRRLTIVPVCDSARRLLGAVTVDDVLERVLARARKEKDHVPADRRES